MIQPVAIFGVPRSGTSWLGQLFNSSPNVAYRYQPLFSYAFKNRLSLHSGKAEIELFHADLLQTQDDFVLQKKNVSGNSGVEFAKGEITHLVWKEVRYLHLIEHLLTNSDLKVIGIIRNPFAVIHSWFRAPKEFDTTWDLMTEWKYARLKNQNKPEEFYGLVKWIEAHAMFTKLASVYSGRFTIVKYEELVANPETELQRLFSFAGIPFTEQSRKFITESTSSASADPYGVHRLQMDVAAWKKEMSQELIALIQHELEQCKLVGY